jgi:hypothetical protein
MNDKQYIEHEVQIRVLKETTESKFVLMQKNFEDKFSSFEKRMDDRFTHTNILIGIVIAAILIPLIKTAIGSVF